MKKIFILNAVIVLLMVTPAFAQDDHETFVARAKAIITADTPCDQLTNADFEVLGEYAMEQMHPGDQHEAMDAMMGGEGSESLEAAHISMGRAFYCGESIGGMMGMMGSGIPAVSRVEGMGGMMGQYRNGTSKNGLNEYCSMMGNSSQQYGLWGMHSGLTSGSGVIHSSFAFFAWPLVLLLLILANIRLWQSIMKGSKHKK